MPVPTLSLDEPTGPGQERHIPELDGMRGLAALAVIFHHIAQNTIGSATGWFHAMLNLMMLGFLGVDVFFALSGFLITRILLRKRLQPRYYRNFYMRRVLRLAPPYLLTIAIVAVVTPSERPFLLLSLVYLANFAPMFHMAMGYGVLWSLSVEEHFYLLWPTLLRSLRTGWLASLCVAVCLLTPLARLYAAHRGVTEFYASWYRFDGMAWGALLAITLATVHPSMRWRNRAAAAVGAAGGLLLAAGLALRLAHRHPTGDALLFGAISMLSAVLIDAAICRPRPLLAPLRSRFLRFFGDISYWIYLIHRVFLNAADRYLRLRHPGFVAHGALSFWLVLTLACLVPAVLTGMLVRRYLELPLLQRKSRFA